MSAIPQTSCHCTSESKAPDFPGSLTIALAGNPNAGKTSLFNSLTGLRQKVANYPGVTVESKSGRFKGLWQKSPRQVCWEEGNR